MTIGKALVAAAMLALAAPATTAFAHDDDNNYYTQHQRDQWFAECELCAAVDHECDPSCDSMDASFDEPI